MNTEEIIVKLTEVDSRSKSNVKRLDNTENTLKSINQLNATLVELVNEIKHTNATVLDHENRLDTIEKRPSDFLNKILLAVGTGVVGAVIGAVMGSVLK